MTHLHPYAQSPSLEALRPETLIDYWDDVPKAPSYCQLTARSQLETELLFHPELTRPDHEKYRKLRLVSDEEISAHGHVLKDVSTSVGKVFVPIVLGIGATPEERWQNTYSRASKLLDSCEHHMNKTPDLSLGIAAELLFSLGIKGPKTIAIPSLSREDRGYLYDGKRFCWDSLLISRGKAIPPGTYRVQVKLSNKSMDYHPDITVVVANPKDEYHVATKKFIDFVRLTMPGTPASNQDMDRYHGRLRSFCETLREHGPSQQRKISDRCLMEAA